jgi:beta-lactamase regulating signal transducer with metallopeptidase domain
MSDALALLLRLNLAAAAAVIAALALRVPVRRLFGPRVAYGVWALAPIAALAMLAPARVVPVVGHWSSSPAPMAAAPMSVHATAPAAVSLADSLPLILAAVWLAGLALAAARLARRQAEFARTVRAGTAGPAVVGVLKPRIVTPDDFAARYSARERELVLAHEATHIARQDSRVNALVAALRCLAWFNPLVHVLAHMLRIDQELACDAQVMAKRPGARRTYAEAMLKTQLTLATPPLGCHWPAPGAHPLAQRITLLARRAPGRATQMLGAASVTLTALAVGWSTWAARPAEFVWVEAPVAAATTTAPPDLPRLAAAPPAASRPVPTRKPARAPAPAAVAPAGAPWTPTDDAPPLTSVSAAAAPPEGCGLPEPSERRLLAPGDFGPDARIRGTARWSVVEPGSAVRVYAAMTDPDGVPLVTDLTAFGSQSRYRVGCIRSHESRYKLFTSVVQNGDRLAVTASVKHDGRWVATGTLDLASGQSGVLTLSDGREVSVVALTRPETADEAASETREGVGRRFVNVLRVPLDI